MIITSSSDCQHYLWGAKTWLPFESCTPVDVEEKTELVYGHVFTPYAGPEYTAYVA